MKRWIHAAVNPWKTKYEVHWVSPDGKDCLLGGSNSIKEANDIAIRQARQILDNPWETDERRYHFIDNLYIVEPSTERDAMLTETEDIIDELMSELDSRIRRVR